MSRPPLEIQIRVADRLKAVAAAQWDAMANPPGARAPGPTAGNGAERPETHNPFASHAFLSALEDSGCVGGRSGWQPVHILVEAGGAGEVVAAAPCYVKGHSQGEYVFDHGWADAYERAGGRYYPKLQVSVPFTPVTGPRLLVSPQADRDTARAALVAGLRALREKIGASSIHLTFLPKADWDALGEDGLLQRVDQQFHWLNDGYAGFDQHMHRLPARAPADAARILERREEGVRDERVVGLGRITGRVGNSRVGERVPLLARDAVQTTCDPDLNSERGAAHACVMPLVEGCGLTEPPHRAQGSRRGPGGSPRTPSGRHGARRGAGRPRCAPSRPSQACA